jgi:hypothetical protein
MHPQDRSGGETGAPSSPESVPLLMADAHRAALRNDCLNALHGILDDLGKPDRLHDPGVTAREGEVFRRLLEALDSEEIHIPDEEMRARIERLSDSYDDLENAEEVIATHGAHRALLRVLEGSAEEDEEDNEDESAGPPEPGRLPGDDADRRRKVLSLLLAEAPHPLVFDDVAVALAGDPRSVSETDDLRDALQILVQTGLARRQGGALAPTRPARQMAELGFSIG